MSQLRRSQVWIKQSLLLLQFRVFHACISVGFCMHVHVSAQLLVVPVIQSFVFSLVCKERGWSLSFHLEEMLSHECVCIANFTTISHKT